MRTSLFLVPRAPPVYLVVAAVKTSGLASTEACGGQGYLWTIMAERHQRANDPALRLTSKKISNFSTPC